MVDASLAVRNYKLLHKNQVWVGNLRLGESATSTIFRSEGQIVVQELAELHHHVGVASVWQIFIRMISLGHPSGVG